LPRDEEETIQEADRKQIHHAPPTQQETAPWTMVLSSSPRHRQKTHAYGRWAAMATGNSDGLHLRRN